MRQGCRESGTRRCYNTGLYLTSVQAFFAPIALFPEQGIFFIMCSPIESRSRELKRVFELVSTADAALAEEPSLKRCRQIISNSIEFYEFMERYRIPDSQLYSLGYFSVLPNEILCSVLSWLNIKDLFRIKRLSNRWKILTSDDALWQFLCFKKGYTKPSFKDAPISWWWLYCSKQKDPIPLGGDMFLGSYEDSNSVADSYEGEFQLQDDGVSRLPHGFGTQYGKSSEGHWWRGTGFFVSGKTRGPFQLSNHIQTYEGMYDETLLAGQRWVGRVVIRWNSGARYEGRTMGDKLSDPDAIYQWPSGNIYRGGMKDDVFCGRGVMVFRNGEIRAGEWENDELITSLDPDRFVMLRPPLPTITK